MPDTILDERTETDLEIEEAPHYPPPALPADGISVIAKTEVITAQRVALPRDYGRIMQKLKVLAAMAGEDWYYRFPVKNRRENRTDYIEGPSVKCATAVAREYGNCALDCRSVDQGPVTLFLARFVDLETGFQLTRPFQQRKSQQTLRGDADRNADIVYQIGASKATRNVVCNALETFTEYAWQQAKRSLIDKVGKNLDSYREKVVARLAELQIDLLRVERILGKTVKEWLAPEVARLIAEIQAINDGMANKDELYPPPPDAEQKPEQTGSKLDQFNEQKNGKKATKEKVDPETGEVTKTEAAQGGTPAAQGEASQQTQDGAGTQQSGAATDQTASQPEPYKPAPEPASPLSSKKKGVEWAPWVEWALGEIQRMPRERLAEFLAGDSKPEFDFIGENRNADWEKIEIALDARRHSGG